MSLQLISHQKQILLENLLFIWMGMSNQRWWGAKKSLANLEPHFLRLQMPIGFTTDSELPIALQLIGNHWTEHKLLGLGAMLEGALSE